MNYSIAPVDIKDPEVEDQLIHLIKDAFGMAQPIAKGHLYKNTVTTKSSGETLFLAAIEDGKIIGCNGFIATDYIHNGAINTCYQSCWTATHPQHQGKKIFVNIINEGKRFLKEKGAGFIYGVPNNNSHPIFLKKLEFKEFPAVMLKIPNVPILRNSYFNSGNGINIESCKANSFLPSEEQIIDLKKNVDNDNIIVIREKKSLLWGKLVSKPFRFGINLKYFYIGGMELEEGGHLKVLMNKVFSEFNIQYVQIVSCKSNLYNNLFFKWKPAQINGFIIYELNSGPIEHLNMFYGAIDVF